MPQSRQHGRRSGNTGKKICKKRIHVCIVHISQGPHPQIPDSWATMIQQAREANSINGATGGFPSRSGPSLSSAEANLCDGNLDEEERTSLAAPTDRGAPAEKRVRVGEGSLITSQTLETVFEEQEAVFCVCGIGGGRRVTELGVGFVALRLADPGESDFGGVVDDDVVAGPHVQRSQAVDEELCETQKF